MTSGFDFEAATALSKGQRDYQEDAIISNFAQGNEVGLVVLADGMGGHAAGDVASKIVVTEVFSELMFHCGEVEAFEASVTMRLREAAKSANACLREHVQIYPETRGMGATLVACVVIGQNLYWISIGDSPLFLFRDGALVQLNEDHSMAPQIDFMVKSGLMPAEEGARHPDRNTLTSVLFGEEVARIDCPQDPLKLEEGDILIVSSDGLQFLSNAQIEAALRRGRESPSADIAHRLLSEVQALEDPDLDNVSFSVVKVQPSRNTSAGDGLKSSAADIRRVG